MVYYKKERRSGRKFPLFSHDREVLFIKEVVSNLVNSKIKELNIYVSDAFKTTEEGKIIFNIVLDSEEVIDLNRITEASRIINKIMDETDVIAHDYDELDIYSEEKGDSSNEQ